MKYLSFSIQNYRAIEGKIFIDLQKSSLIPLVGVNECGKTTILQGLYCFDQINDAEYGGKHLKDTKNLYKTKDKEDPIIQAGLNIAYGEFKEIYEEVVEEVNEEIKKENETNQEVTGYVDKEPMSEKMPISRESYDSKLIIERNLHTKQYRIVNISGLDESVNPRLAAKIISYMPYILYNDDFMDRPPNSIVIPAAKPILTGWLAIFERLFKSTSEDYSLFSIIKEGDPRRRDAIISDVEEHLNRTLSKTWRGFSLTQGDITIKLKLATNEKKENVVEIKIVEKLNQKERFFDVIDRSKGFLWFFNFVMKVEFNPKILAGKEKDTLYLLDEPGSYLHYAAQEKLCNKLVNISKKHGTVIYCTHSHRLLNPEQIPLNHIYIVEKDRQKKIKATPITEVKTKAQNNNAFQPVLEALQISAFDFGYNNNPVIAVEGIYDKYAIEIMLDLKNTFVLPGTSANSVLKNIQFLNGFNCLYIAIWDNDEEGERQYREASKFFGEIEASKFDRLPKLKRQRMKMEDMFGDQNLILMRKEMELPKDSDYEKIISSLYFSPSSVKTKVVEKLSEETKGNFLVLKEIIDKRFERAKDLKRIKE